MLSSWLCEPAIVVVHWSASLIDSECCDSGTQLHLLRAFTAPSGQSRLTRRPTFLPYTADADAIMQFFETIVVNDLRPVVPPTMPQDYTTLMEHCWATDPTERPTTQQLIDCLQHMAVLRRQALVANGYASGWDINSDVQAPSSVSSSSGGEMLLRNPSRRQQLREKQQQKMEQAASSQQEVQARDVQQRLSFTPDDDELLTDLGTDTRLTDGTNGAAAAASSAGLQGRQWQGRDQQSGLGPTQLYSQPASGDASRELPGAPGRWFV